MDKAEAKKAQPTRQASKKGTGAKRRTGASRKQRQKRLGRPVAPVRMDAATPERAAAWLESTARSQLAGGRSLRTKLETNRDALEAIEAVCRAHAAPLKARKLPPNLVAGAALLAKRAASADESANSGLASLAVRRLADLVSPLREGLLRALPGSRNVEARKSFGLDVPLYPIDATHALNAAKGILAGDETAAETEADGLFIAEDLDELRAQIKVVEAEKKQAASRRSAAPQATAERDVLNAALELFYDQYASRISVVLKKDPAAKIAALQLIPRREDRRGGEGGGTGGGGGSGG